MALDLPLHQNENENENTGLRLVCQAGRCCEKASTSELASVFCKTAPAFAQRIKPVIFGLPIRVYLGNPWLKSLLPIRVN